MKEAILGFGAMRLPQIDPNDPGTIEMEEFRQMVDYYMEQGFDYFDTSYAYHNERSKMHLKRHWLKDILVNPIGLPTRSQHGF